MAKTLMELAGMDLTLPSFQEASLVLIDYQNEYLEGPVALPQAEPAVLRAREVLEQARRAGAPVVHIAHKGRPDGPFDRNAKRGQIIETLQPIEGEFLFEKPLPNSFAATGMDDALKEAGRSNVVMIGFMTHMCVSSTARAALDLGYRVSIDAKSCASRDLPDGMGGVVNAAEVHRVALAELSDRFAIIAHHHSWV